MKSDLHISLAGYTVCLPVEDEYLLKSQLWFVYGRISKSWNSQIVSDLEVPAGWLEKETGPLFINISNSNELPHRFFPLRHFEV